MEIVEDKKPEKSKDSMEENKRECVQEKKTFRDTSLTSFRIIT